MVMEQGCQSRVVPDEFAERLRLISEARELQRGYAEEMRNGAFATWSILAAIIFALWLYALVARDPGSVPGLARPILIQPPAQPSPHLLVLDANARWFQQCQPRALP
jgi:hypothetical protein